LRREGVQPAEGQPSSVDQPGTVDQPYSVDIERAGERLGVEPPAASGHGGKPARRHP
jgi:hypothetical protein